jgi:hypothetical protein
MKLGASFVLHRIDIVPRDTVRRQEKAAVDPMGEVTLTSSFFRPCLGCCVHVCRFYVSGREVLVTLFSLLLAPCPSGSILFVP